MCDKKEALSILEEVYHRCKGLMPEIRSAYLYGSYARGDYHAESDVDILLTADLTQQDIERKFMEIAEISSAVSLAHDITVSVAVKPEKSFFEYSAVLPFYQNVLREGIAYG